MRPERIILLSTALLFFVCSASARSTPPDKLEHPGEVALLETDAGWKYVHFPTNLHLYTYDLDTENSSACNVGCSTTWLPVIAPDNAEPIGDWTIITREDDRRQWAYKGRPVYLLYHDSPTDPVGDGHDGVWHLLKP